MGESPDHFTKGRGLVEIGGMSSFFDPDELGIGQEVNDGRRRLSREW
jgi:hypothetical protein